MDLYSESAPFNGKQACLSVDPEIFFPEDYENREAVFAAKTICKKCPLTTDCLIYAVKDSKLDGIWGATTPAERKNLRRRKVVLN